MSSRKVYFKVNDDEACDTELPPCYDTVSHLQFAIFFKNPHQCTNGPQSIHVFAVGSDPGRDEPLKDISIVPSNSSLEKPLVVMVEGATAKRRRVNISVSNSSLLNPREVTPPKVITPEFICPQDWLSDVQVEILSGLESVDGRDTEKDGVDDETLYRVPPMSIVRCSRGGKTRALYEIANEMKGFSRHLEEDVACLYVSFNDDTGLRLWEQEDPLQALLRRIAFAASIPDTSDRSIGEQFDEFLNDKPTWEIVSFLKWIDDTPCVLLIDELNNLEELTKPKSVAAEDFGRFLKFHFIGKKNRYLVFSSHVLGTNMFLSQYVDRSKGSSRHVELQELPLVPSLREATSLKPSLDSAREAVYYGLVPGMIYESGKKGKNIAGKRQTKVMDAIKKSTDLEFLFRSILRSLIDGRVGVGIPEDLHILLDSAKGKEDCDYRIRWVPYHLQYVLDQLGASNFANQQLARKLADCCNLTKDAKEKSGEGWESLFVLFLMARCLNQLADETFVPGAWFESPQNETAVHLNERCYDASLNSGRLFSECKTWDSMKNGVCISETPQIAVIYPTHDRFEVYDVIVAYSRHGKRGLVYGYQLQESKAPINRVAHKDMTKSFFVQGTPPATTKETTKGWTVPSQESINSFFGESGKHWTPECWRKFKTHDS